MVSLAKLGEKPVVAMNPSPLEFTYQVLQVFLSFPAQPEGSGETKGVDRCIWMYVASRDEISAVAVAAVVGYLRGSKSV